MEKVKGIRNRRGYVVILFVEDRILHTEGPKVFARKLFTALPSVKLQDTKLTCWGNIGLDFLNEGFIVAIVGSTEDMNVHDRALDCERLGVETLGPMTCIFCQQWGDDLYILSTMGGQRMKLLNPLFIFSVVITFSLLGVLNQ